ncbi:hypothetical protein HDE76_001412 [Rhodanobacter sp. ANJX3]|uniref:hypothetical protein n=1 Tax=Rhodanobacter sp. ANJX3 TaxID=2723083 RepID=UPI001613BD65|nr:hypothetical protein [Rhodanobacter sp. ANJX3]
MNRDQQRLNHQLDRLGQKLPSWAARSLQWLRKSSSRWVRLPAGFLLVLGGIFSILPVLGLWMLPLGLLLLVQDVPFLRRPTRQALTCIERRWRRHKRRRRQADA